MFRDKTDEELNVIFDSISSYTGEFIDNYLDELDKRRMLWDNLILLREKELIAITLKLESIPDAKYLNLLKRELEIRGLDEAFKKQKNVYTESASASKTERQKLIRDLCSGLIPLVFLGSFLMKKYNENKPKQYFNDEITVPSVNPTNHLKPANINFYLPELETKKNPGIQKILDSISK